MRTTNINPHNNTNNAGFPPVPPKAPRQAGLHYLAEKWLCPDFGAPLRVIRSGRLPVNRLRFVEVETMSSGRVLAMLFFQSRRDPRQPWSVVPDSLGTVCYPVPALTIAPCPGCGSTEKK